MLLSSYSNEKQKIVLVVLKSVIDSSLISCSDSHTISIQATQLRLNFW